jgi:FixJ family two-component response regulator
MNKNNSALPLITVVDDDDSVRDSIQSLIRSVGFRASSFASAEEFLQSDFLHKASCLILDVRMTGMTGLKLQKHLKEKNFKIPIIFISAHYDETTRSQALNDGAVEFLSKPFKEEALLRAIDVALHSSDEEK